MLYRIVLKSLEAEDQYIILDDALTRKDAEAKRKMWRTALGNKRWSIDRRPGLDTLSHLALTVIEKGTSASE